MCFAEFEFSMLIVSFSYVYEGIGGESPIGKIEKQALYFVIQAIMYLKWNSLSYVNDFTGGVENSNWKNWVGRGASIDSVSAPLSCVYLIDFVGWKL